MVVTVAAESAAALVEGMMVAALAASSAVAATAAVLLVVAVVVAVVRGGAYRGRASNGDTREVVQAEVGTKPSAIPPRPTSMAATEHMVRRPILLLQFSAGVRCSARA